MHHLYPKRGAASKGQAPLEAVGAPGEGGGPPRIDCPLGSRTVRLLVTDETVEVRLARWEKVLGLMRDVVLARADVGDVQLVEEPVREAMRSGIKVGLRLPWVIYVARTIGLDQAFVVRRGAPGLSFSVRNHEPLRRVVLSTPQARELVGRLGG